MKNDFPDKPLFGVPNKSLVLIIDDQASILMLLKEILEFHDYQAETFQEFVNAKEFYQKYNDYVKAIILDMQLIETDYHFTIPALFEINPEVKIIAMSGAIHLNDISPDFRLKIQCLLRKPFLIEDLLAELKKI